MTVSADSKQRLLDAAETLFAERGFHATSTRQITAAAGVNLAAVNYHFGTKDGLIAAVFERFLRPVNAERLLALDALEAPDLEPDLEAIITAFVAPPFRARGARDQHVERAMRLYGRIHSAPEAHAHAIFVQQFDTVRKRFESAFARALPNLPRRELHWRMHFLIGAMAQTLADPERLCALSGGACDPYDVEATLERLVPFLTAGMRAASLPTQRAGGARKRSGNGTTRRASSRKTRSRSSRSRFTRTRRARRSS